MRPVVKYDALVGHALRQARQKTGLAQGEAANLCGMTQSMLSRFESGLVSPTLRQLARMKPLIGIDLLATLADVVARTEARGVVVLYDDALQADDVELDTAALMRTLK